MSNTCKSLPELEGKTKDFSLASEFIDKSDTVFGGVFSNSASTLKIHNIHGDLDHLIRMTYVTLGVLEGQGMALFIVDQEHFDDAVAMFNKHFQSRGSPALPQKDGVDFALFKIIKGGPENQKARVGTEQDRIGNMKEVDETVDRVLQALTKFEVRNEAGDIVLPDFVWHNATSAEIVMAMPDSLMKEHCKGIFFACGVILTSTSFMAGAHYDWYPEGHNDMVAKAVEWELPVIYYHGTTMGIKAQTLSQMPGFTTAVFNLVPQKIWEKLLFKSMDQLAIWLIRWLEGIWQRWGDQPVERAIEIFSQVAKKELGWADKVFEASSYPKSECIIAVAEQRASSVVHRIRYPIDQSLDVAVGMVIDYGFAPADCLLVPGEIDFAKCEVKVSLDANTYILTSPTKRLGGLLASGPWRMLLQKLHINSKKVKLPAGIAATWISFVKRLAGIPAFLHEEDVLDELVKGEMTRLAGGVDDCVF